MRLLNKRCQQIGKTTNTINRNDEDEDADADEYTPTTAPRITTTTKSTEEKRTQSSFSVQMFANYFYKLL